MLYKRSKSISRIVEKGQDIWLFPGEVLTKQRKACCVVLKEELEGRSREEFI